MSARRRHPTATRGAVTTRRTLRGRRRLSPPVKAERPPPDRVSVAASTPTVLVVDDDRDACNQLDAAESRPKSALISYQWSNA